MEVNLRKINNITGFKVSDSNNAYDLETFVRLTKNMEWPREVILERFPIFKGKNIYSEKLDYLLETLEPMDGQTAMSMGNLEQRAECVKIVGAGKIMKELNAIKIDTQTLHKEQPKWEYIDGKLVESVRIFDDVYTLWRIPASSLNKIFRFANDVYFVECKCTTTDRVFYLYVNPRVKNVTTDAISAIASTFGITDKKENIDYVFRQGDTLHIKHKDNSDNKKVSKWYFTKEDYLNYLKSES